MSTSNSTVYKEVPKVENSSVCPVCTDEAPPDETHHPHYGAICCYGCKAFFRRAHQNNRVPQYKCKRDGKCVIFPKCKQHCKRCRLDKCISVGMDPKWVMSNDEKRIRFKNFFKKKDEQAQIESSADSSSIPTGQARKRRRKNPPESQPDSNLGGQSEESPQEVTSPSTSRSQAALTILPSRSTPSVTQQTTSSPVQQLFESNRQLDASRCPNPTNLTQQVNQSRPNSTVNKEFCRRQCQRDNVEAEKPFNIQFPSSASQPTLDLYTSFGLTQKPMHSKQSFHHVSQAEHGELQIQVHNQTKSSTSFNQEQNSLSHSQWPLLQQRMAPVASYTGSKQDQYLNQMDLFSTANIFSSPMRNVWHPQSQNKNNCFQSESKLAWESNNETLENPNHLWSDKFSNKSEVGSETLTNYYQPSFLSHRTQLSTVLDAFTLISGKVGLNSDLSRDIILTHQRQKPMEKSMMMAQLSMIASMLAEFATSQFIFTSLNREDQAILLKANIPLYLQYILARYFTSESGLEQINWILEGQILIDSIEVITSLTRISLQQYNESVSLFSTSEMVELYKYLSSNVGMFYPFPQHCNGLIANMLLYHTDETMINQLKEKKRIDCIFHEAKELVKLGFYHLDREMGFDAGKAIGPLINSLTKMNHLFGMCRVQARAQELDQTVPKQLEINYTSAEELWMKQKLGDFETEYRSVAPPRDYFVELVNLLVSAKEVSKTFVASWMGMETERVRRVLKMHPEFSSLSDRDQETIWRKNHTSAIALSVIRINILTSGKEQFKHIIGVLNPHDTNWDKQYKDSVDLGAFNCNYLQNREVNNGRLDQASITCYIELKKELSQFCHNVQVYQLFVLLTLLDMEGLCESSSFIEILKMRQIYLKCFQRKLASVGCSFVDYAHFRRTLKKVKIIANLMENFII